MPEFLRNYQTLLALFISAAGVGLFGFFKAHFAPRGTVGRAFDMIDKLDRRIAAAEIVITKAPDQTAMAALSRKQERLHGDIRVLGEKIDGIGALTRKLNGQVDHLIQYHIERGPEKR